jgi:hypothetical protein
MNARLAHLLVRLYPGGWRERYGAEFEQLLHDTDGTGPRMLFNVLGAALREHMFPTTLAAGATARASVIALVRRPSAALPMLMSLAALLLLLGFLLLASRGVITFQTADGDEGLVARLWQLLMVGQLPIIGFFALRWFRRRPLQTLAILAVQAMLAFASIVPIFILEN